MYVIFKYINILLPFKRKRHSTIPDNIILLYNKFKSKLQKMCYTRRFHSF
nr:MAG TPA: hypothetical protein [Caudoviricetes sp.]